MSDVIKNYHLIPDNQDGVFVVTTEMGYWGADEQLAQACENAGLTERRAIDFFDNVDGAAGLKTAWSDWLDWGKAETRFDDDDEVEITAYWLSRQIWEGWRVNPVHGSVTAFPKSQEHSGEVLDAMLAEARMDAHWRNGELKPR